MKYVLEAIEAKTGGEQKIKLTVKKASGRKLVIMCSSFVMQRVDEPVDEVVDVEYKEIDHDG